MPEATNGSVYDALVNSGWIERTQSRLASGHSNSVDVIDLAVGAVGIDVGGTKIRAVAAGASPGGPGLAERIVATDPAGGIAVVEQIVALCEELTGDHFRAVAVACPGALDRNTGRINYAPNLPGWDELDVAGEIRGRLGAQPLVENDVLAAARAESLVSGASDLAFLALGTGIGLGMILDGVPRVGGHSQAGEVCHLPLGADPFDRELHRHGVLESRLAGPRIFEEYKAAGGIAGTLSEAFDNLAEPASRSVFASTARLLALTVRTVSAVVDPQVVVLGGGVGSRRDLIAAVGEELLRLGGGPIVVRRSILGSRAAAAGALAAACDSPLRGQHDRDLAMDNPSRLK